LYRCLVSNMPMSRDLRGAPSGGQTPKPHEPESGALGR